MEIRFDSLESWERGGRRWHLLGGVTSVKVEEMRKISSDDVPKMLQALLADRFKLVVWRETKEHGVLALVVGKGSPNLKASAEAGSSALCGAKSNFSTCLAFTRVA